MRQALRRILWLLPTLVVLSIAGFWAVSASLQPAQPGVTQRQPRFFNPAPTNVRILTETAMAEVASAGPSAAASGAELVRLGGAALPFLLPRLDTLTPPERARVALALAPLGQRMAIGDADELDDPDAAVVFWTRFWQDRALDFRELVVRRAVTRLASKGSALRRADVLALDTFALPELINQLTLPTDSSEIARTRRLVASLSHITGRATLPANASTAEAQAVVQDYRGWWRRERSSFVPREGTDRVVAMFRDTEYGEWLTATVVYRSDELFKQLGRASVPSLRLAGWAILASALATLALLLGPGASCQRRHLVLSIASCAPLVPALIWAGGGGAALLMATYGGIRAAILIRTASDATTLRALSQAERGFGLSSLSVRLRRARLGLGYLVSDLPAMLPGLFSACIVVELATGTEALGTRTLSAIAERDVGWVMVLLVGLTGLVAVAQVVSDAYLGVLDPRLGEALRHRQGRVV